ncbi:TolB-like protein [Bradyrhizobium sp. F1.13.4]
MRYLFEEFVLDADRRELHRRAEVISIAPQAFDLLHYLICNRSRVVSKDDLIKAIWNDRAVSDAALTTRINAVRSAIGDSGETQRLIKTLPRKGFRFVGLVQDVQQALVLPEAPGPKHVRNTVGPWSSPPHLSIVVLPFTNLSGDPEQAYFVDGVTESLTTDLSRIRGSFVIGRHTAFAYRGKVADLKQIGRELNVRYALQGSIQCDCNRLRVNVQLVDTETGSHLWADRFDASIADLLDMQDEIVARLANTVDAQLIEAEARRAENTPNPDAMDFIFRGRHSFNEGLTSKSLTQARAWFGQALAMDAENIDATVWMAAVDVTSSSTFLTDDLSHRLAAAETMLLKALSYAPEPSLCTSALRNRSGAYESRAPRPGRVQPSVRTGSQSC